MLEEIIKLSRKWQSSGKLFYPLGNAKSAYIKAPEYPGDWSCDSEIISSFTLRDLLWLLLCWRNSLNYWPIDRFLENSFSVNKLVVDNSVRYFNNSQRKSLVAMDNIKFFRICVWIWICVSNTCLNNNSFKICLLKKTVGYFKSQQSQFLQVSHFSSWCSIYI